VTTNSGEKTNFGPHFFFFLGLLYVSFILIIEFPQSNWGPVALVWGSLQITLFVHSKSLSWRLWVWNFLWFF
jgi:hypothetical protein